MNPTKSLLALIAALAAAGCSQTPVIDSLQPDAIHTAQRRGAFELNCPGATAEVLSREIIQSPIMNPRFAPPQRAEYTVGVSGCGHQATYVVICPDDGSSNCFAGGGRTTVR